MSNANTWKSPRYWGAIWCLASTIWFGLHLELSILPTITIAVCLLIGLWLGGRFPLWLSLFHSTDNKIILDNRREWATALTFGVLCVIATAHAFNLTPTKCLTIATPGVIFAYAGGKLGCYRYGCCDWSARFFTEKISLPLIEGLLSGLLGIFLHIGLIFGIAERTVLILGITCLGLIRQSALFFRDEPVFYFKSIKVDGIILLLSVPFFF